MGVQHFALKAAGINATVLAAFDINTNANEVYKHNFPTVKVVQRLIECVLCVCFTTTFHFRFLLLGDTAGDGVQRAHQRADDSQQHLSVVR